MFEFFAKLLTPLFIALGFVSPAPVIPVTEPTPVVEQMVQEKAPIIDVATTSPESIETSPATISQSPTPPITQEIITPSAPAEINIQPEPLDIVIPPKPEPIIELPATTTEAVEVIFPKPRCGTNHNDTLLTVPTSDLCRVGTTTDTFLDNSEYSWSCVSGDQELSCEARITEHGACGVSSDVSLPSGFNTDTLCSAGTLTKKQTSLGEMTWSCQGINNGYDAQCSAKLKIAGSCGSANGLETTSTPTQNLCRTGTVTPVKNSLSGDYVWSCSGINTGSSAMCTAPKKDGTATPAYTSPEPLPPEHPCSAVHWGNNGGFPFPPPGCN